MALVLRRPFRHPARRTVWDAFFGPHVITPQDRTFAPLVDLQDLEDKFVLDVDLPGFNKEEVTVDVTPKFVDIVAERNVEEDEEKDNYIFRERGSFVFRRRIRLPQTVDIENADSSFEEGVLHVELRKAPEKDRKRLAL